MQVIVTTSEISREEDFTAQVPPLVVLQHDGETKNSKQNISVIKKKPFKKVAKKRSRPKPQNKRDRKKGKKKNKKHT